MTDLYYASLTKWHSSHRMAAGQLLTDNIAELWTDEALAEVGLYRAKTPDPIPPGKRVTSFLEWTGSEVRYRLEDIPAVTTAGLRAYAAEKRWQVEQGGMIWNGWPTATDDRSQGKINSEVLAVQVGEREDGEAWKFADGVFRMLTNDQVVDMGRAARAHVANSFFAEGAVVAAILAGDITTEEQIDAQFASAFAG